MSVLVPSTIIGAEGSPLSTDLWALAYLFLADWKVTLSLETAYTTDVTSASTVAESRIGLVNRPYRTMTASFIGFGRDEGLSLKMLLSRLAQARNLIPVYMDASKLTAAASGSTLSCDTASRRFQDGARVVVAEPSNGNGMFAQFEVAEIDSFTDTDITLKAPLSGSFPKGSKVYPLMEARLSLAGSGVHLRADAFEARLTFIESTGEQTLFPTTTPGASPSGYPLAPDGLPIMDRRFNWSDSVTGGVRRQGGYSQLGRDSVVRTFGTRARTALGFTVTSVDRSEIFDLLEFFESRAGRLYPFWIPSPLCDYTASAITQTTVTVASVGPEFDWEFRPNIAIIMKDGTIHIAEVDLVVRGSGVDVVTFVDPLPVSPAIADVSSVRIAYRVRFSADSIRESWITGRLGSATLSAVELLEEKSVVVNELTTQPSGFSDLGISGEKIGGGFVWPARPWDTTSGGGSNPSLVMSMPTISEFTKSVSADRIGNRVFMHAFGAATARGVWAKFYNDNAGAFSLTFRLEDEETGDVMAEVTLDETMLAVAYGSQNEENFAYVQFDSKAVITGDRWYRITVEASPWADFHMSRWAGRGREMYYAVQREFGIWEDTPADVLALALLLDGGDLT